MNKGLEMIEAHFLFDIPMEDIEVLVHKESIVHSMVEFIDHSVLAQMSYPDMRLPIQYALTYPQRRPIPSQTLDFSKIGALTFRKPDEETFICLRLCKEAAKTGGSMPAALNAANEEAVALFLAGRISFLEIGALVEKSMHKHSVVINPTIADILEIDAAVREQVRDLAGVRASDMRNSIANL
jgi:1-deoxy-D-xylulose-5-phosphate reductoisomerase